MFLITLIRDAVQIGLLTGRPKYRNPENAKLATYVEKARIAENSDYNLSRDRYRALPDHNNTKWPMVPIGDLCALYNGKAFRPSEWQKKDSGGLPIVRIQNLNNPNADFNYYCGKVDERITINDGDLLFSWSGFRGTSFGPHIWNGSKAILNQHIFKVVHNDTISRGYFYQALQESVAEVEENLHGGVGLVHITKGDLKKIKIPLPPLEIQEQIVRELSGYQKIISGAKQIVANWQPKIEIDPAWEKVKLEDICTIKHGYAFKSEQFEKGDNNTVLPIVLAPGDFMEQGGVFFKEGQTRRYSGEIDLEYLLKMEDLVVVMTDLSSKMKILGNPAIIKQDNILHNQRIGKVILKRDKINIQYLYYSFLTPQVKEKIKQSATGTLIKHTSPSRILECEIFLPSFEIQQQIVAKIEAEQILVEAAKKLIPIYEQKTKEVIANIF